MKESEKRYDILDRSGQRALDLYDYLKATHPNKSNEWYKASGYSNNQGSDLTSRYIDFILNANTTALAREKAIEILLRIFRMNHLMGQFFLQFGDKSPLSSEEQFTLAWGLSLRYAGVAANTKRGKECRDIMKMGSENLTKHFGPFTDPSTYMPNVPNMTAWMKTDDLLKLLDRELKEK